MPPLHRMPIVYLVGLAASVPLVIAAISRSDRAEPAPLDRRVDVAELPEPVRIIEGNPDDGILRTDDGLRRKVLIRGLGVVPRRSPDLRGRGVGDAIDYYSIHYVRDERPADGTEPRAFEIGPARGPSLGWVSEEAVLPWNTRLMALPTPRSGRPRLLIYRERSCLLDALDGRRCPEHGEWCPIEGEEPEGGPPPSVEPAAAPTLGMPILQFDAIPQPDGSSRTLFEVASLVDDRAPPPTPVEPPDHLRRWLRQIDIAFVIDTTSSMRRYIEAARSLAAELSDRAASDEATLRLALVAYRDQHPSFGYNVRIAAPFSTIGGFRAALDRLEASTRGDGSVDESVLDGIDAALPPAVDERTGTIPHLSWPIGREGDLASKLVVLIGDAPDHDRDLDRAAMLAKRAQDHRITIAAVSIARDDLRGDEPERYRSQWRALADGSFLPRDSDRGFREPIDPVLPTLDDPSMLGPTLKSILQARVENARELAAILEAEAEDRLVDYVDRRGLTLDQIAPVLVDIHRGEPAPSPRRDPSHLGERAPSIRRGWIAETIEDDQLVTVEVLMNRAELDALIADLVRIQQLVQSDADATVELGRIGDAAASGESAFLDSGGGRTFAEGLRGARGLPPAPPESLLQRSATDVLQADEPYRLAVLERLSEAIAVLIRRRDEINWDDPKATASEMALVPFDAIDF